MASDNNQITRIDFKIVWRPEGAESSEWLSLDDPRLEPERMLDMYASISGLSCCDFQGGFFIDVDGMHWSDPSTIDEFRMTMIWFDAMTALVMKGADSFGPGYGPWEQSALVWTRWGDDVEMADTYAGGDRMWPVTVDLHALARDVAHQGRAFATWARRIREGAQSKPPNSRALIHSSMPNEEKLGRIDALAAAVL